MDRQITYAAAGLLVVTVLGAYAGSGSDRGVVDARGVKHAPAAKQAVASAPARISLAQAHDDAIGVHEARDRR